MLLLAGAWEAGAGEEGVWEAGVWEGDDGVVGTVQSGTEPAETAFSAVTAADVSWNRWDAEVDEQLLSFIAALFVPAIESRHHLEFGLTNVTNVPVVDTNAIVQTCSGFPLQCHPSIVVVDPAPQISMHLAVAEL